MKCLPNRFARQLHGSDLNSEISLICLAFLQQTALSICIQSFFFFFFFLIGFQHESASFFFFLKISNRRLAALRGTGSRSYCVSSTMAAAKGISVDAAIVVVLNQNRHFHIGGLHCFRFIWFGVKLMMVTGCRSGTNRSHQHMK